VDTAGNETIQTYRGKIKYEADMLYLRFKPQNPSIQLNPFLIKEISGNYLIQTFNNNKERHFLRLTYPNHRFY